MKRMIGSSRWLAGLAVVGAVAATVSTGVLDSNAAVAQPKTSVSVAGHAGTVAAVKQAVAKKSTVQMSSWEVEQMVAMIRQVAYPSTSRMVEVKRDDAGRSASLRSITIVGDYTLSASVSADPNGIKTGRSNCKADQQHPEDGRNCKTLLSRSTVGIWLRDFPARPGRQTLELAARTREGGTLWMRFDNYLETADGTKVVGAKWQDLGITKTELLHAAEQSELTVTLD